MWVKIKGIQYMHIDIKIYFDFLQIKVDWYVYLFLYGEIYFWYKKYIYSLYMKFKTAIINI
jgi:hypothetical protein